MRTLLLTLTTCLLVLPVQAKYSGGSGTAKDPYQIATTAHLIALGETPADYGKHFVMTADIDLDPNLPGRKVFDKAVIAPDTNSRHFSQTSRWLQLRSLCDRSNSISRAHAESSHGPGCKHL